MRNSLGSHAPLFDIPQPIFPGIDGIQVINILGTIVSPEPVRQCLVCCKCIVRPNPLRRLRWARDQSLGLESRNYCMLGEKRKEIRQYTKWGKDSQTVSLISE